MWRIVLAALELFRAILAKFSSNEKADAPKDQPPPRITKASVDKQVAHQRELFKKNHPRK